MYLNKVGNINQKFVEWFNYHPPLPEESDVLINIAKGVVVSENVNCYKTFELGLYAACKVNDVRLSEVKLSKKDKVITIL